MKLDYVLAEKSLVLSGGVESSEILSGVWSREGYGFMGSDHAPLMCVLHPRWQRKRGALLAHYAALKPHEMFEDIKTIKLMHVQFSFAYRDVVKKWHNFLFIIIKNLSGQKMTPVGFGGLTLYGPL
jgi:hypothetical protein